MSYTVHGMVSALLLLSIVVAFTAGFAVARRAPAALPPPDVEARSQLQQTETPLRVEASPVDSPPTPKPVTLRLPPIPVAAPVVVVAEPAEVAGEAVEVVREERAEVALAIREPSAVPFDPVATRGTRSFEMSEQAEEWKQAMLAAGERFADANVCAIVFVHGTFMGSDPLSAYRFVERALPNGVGAAVARVLRKKTRESIEWLLGDLGNFGSAYVRLFEEALRPSGARIPCTEYVWSSENHHVGRLEGALGLVRVLATHAELSGDEPRRILVIGHSHAGQLFALATQLLAQSMATEAILDVARARGVDVSALEADIETLAGRQALFRKSNVGIDFVTFGAPNRYAWASIPNVRALHVIAVPKDSSGTATGDLIRRLGVEGSDFPALSGEDRRINHTLSESLGHAGLSPAKVATALREGAGLPNHGELALVDYGDAGLLASGLSHGAYTRVDAMLFHARLVADRLYGAAAKPSDPELEASSMTTVAETAPELEEEPAPLAARAWSALRAFGPSRKSRPPS